jgi:hypothetical protein
LGFHNGLVFFSGRNKQLPFFSEYLATLVNRGKVDGARIGVAGAVLGTLGGLTGAVVGILGGTGVIQFSGPGIAAFVFGVQAATFLGIYGVWVSEKKKANSQIPNQELFKEVRPIGLEMNQSLMRRKLHRDITPTAATILEEGARQFARVTQALSGSFWQDPDLADHWKSIRDHAAAGVDRAMLELILLLKSSFKPNSGPSGWQGVVVDVVEQLGGTVEIERGDDLMPVTFEQAQQVLLTMSELADEIEQASKDLIAEGVIEADDKLRSRLAISQTIQELRAVREAEEELKRNLGDR